MDSNVKGLLFLGVLVGGIFALSKAANAQDGVTKGASVQISGLPGGDLVEGGSYTLTATVTNNSTRSGSPVGASLLMSFSGSVGGVFVLSPSGAGNVQASFGPGESKSFNVNFTIPFGVYGSGGFTCVVSASGAGTLAMDTISVNVQQAAINYAAQVSLS